MTIRASAPGARGPSASGGIGSVEVDWNWLDTQATTSPPQLRVELPLRTTVGLSTELALAAVLDATCPSPPLDDGWLTLTPALTLTPNVAMELLGHDYDDAPVDFDLALTRIRPFPATNGAWCSTDTPHQNPIPTTSRYLAPDQPRRAGSG